MFHRLLHRAALAAAISVGVAGLSLADEPRPMDDGIVVRIANDGVSETLYLDQLAVGETREFTTESGKPAFVTRSEEGMEIELDGDVTKIRYVPFDVTELAELDDPELAALFEAHAGGEVRMVRIDGDDVLTGSDRQIVRIHSAGEGDGHEGTPVRKVMVVHGDGTHAFAHGEGAHAFHIATDAAGHGKTVIVERRKTRSGQD